MDKLLFRKAAGYCAYQERTHEEVRNRLKKWNIWGDEAEEIIAALVEGNFLNESRFARAYSGGKFRVKHWGRLRIEQELIRKGVSARNVREAIAGITPEQYREGLSALLQKKRQALTRTVSDKRLLRQKLMRYAIGKGYEADLVREVLESTEDDNQQW